MPLAKQQFRSLKRFSLLQLQKIQKEFIRQSLAAAKGQSQSLAWFDSLINPWKKQLITEGPVVLIDLGGSFIRLGAAESVDGNGLKWAIPIKKEPSVNEHLSPEDFVDWLVSKTWPLIKKIRAKRVGFIFSYPHQPKKLDQHVTGIVTQLTKALIIPGIQGVDVGKLYIDRLIKKGVRLERFVILNDTVAVALSAPQAIAGVVIGTGANICGMQPKLKNLRNIEAGNFDGIPHTLASASVDLWERTGYQTMEKQSTGRYQFRLLAFEAMFSGMRLALVRGIMAAGVKVESLVVSEASLGKFNYLNSLSLTKIEKQQLKKMAQLILENSYQMWATALAAVIKMNAKQLNNQVVVPVTGGVILNDPIYFAGFKKTAKQLTGKTIQLIKVKDPIKGAAVAALMEN